MRGVGALTLLAVDKNLPSEDAEAFARARNLVAMGVLKSSRVGPLRQTETALRLVLEQDHPSTRETVLEIARRHLLEAQTQRLTLEIWQEQLQPELGRAKPTPRRAAGWRTAF